MEENLNNIDQLIKAKFDDFAPTPPEHIWKGVEKGISSRPAFFALYSRQIAAAIVLLGLLLLGVWYFSSRSSESPVNKSQFSDSVPASTSDNPATINNTSETAGADALNNTSVENNNASGDTQENNLAGTMTKSENAGDHSVAESPAITKNPAATETNTTVEVETTQTLAVEPSETNLTLTLYNETEKDIISIPSLSLALGNTVLPKENVPQNRYSSQSAPAIPAVPAHKSGGSWATGLYFTPEMYFENYDSLKTLPSYTLSVEPTYYINKHLFVRFGLGFTYAHDRGFTRINYSGKNLVGTYEDVYDVTFDSVNGQLVPTYYTKTKEIWDTTNQVAVKEPTNTYFYVQTPLMLGYYKRSRNINWYFYGGPSFNYMISKSIEKPAEDLDYVELFGVYNHLPKRSDYYIQLWLGAGIELKVSNNISLALEPNYRLTLNDLYNEQAYRKPLSGFAVRFGVVYYFK